MGKSLLLASHGDLAGAIFRDPDAFLALRGRIALDYAGADEGGGLSGNLPRHNSFLSCAMLREDALPSPSLLEWLRSANPARPDRFDAALWVSDMAVCAAESRRPSGECAGLFTAALRRLPELCSGPAELRRAALRAARALSMPDDLEDPGRGIDLLSRALLPWCQEALGGPELGLQALFSMLADNAPYSCPAIADLLTAANASDFSKSCGEFFCTAVTEMAHMSRADGCAAALEKILALCWNDPDFPIPDIQKIEIVQGLDAAGVYGPSYAKAFLAYPGLRRAVLSLHEKDLLAAGGPPEPCAKVRKPL